MKSGLPRALRVGFTFHLLCVLGRCAGAERRADVHVYRTLGIQRSNLSTQLDSGAISAVFNMFKTAEAGGRLQARRGTGGSHGEGRRWQPLHPHGSIERHATNPTGRSITTSTATAASRNPLPSSSSSPLRTGGGAYAAF